MHKNASSKDGRLNRPYHLEAIIYPPTESEADTVRLVDVLEQVAADYFQSHLKGTDAAQLDRLTPADWYEALWLQIDRLLDCGGAPTPQHADRLIQAAALAVAARLSWDRLQAPGESGEVMRPEAAP
jgi:ABC-type uncharacterized transport system fused permease/ATPase subunit